MVAFVKILSLALFILIYQFSHSNDIGSSACTWGEWTTEGGCSKSCGNGEKVRTRTKTGGSQCSGAETGTISCNTQTCPNTSLSK